MLTLHDLAQLARKQASACKLSANPTPPVAAPPIFGTKYACATPKRKSCAASSSKPSNPIEKWIRIGIGPISVEGIPRGRYRTLKESELEALRKAASPVRKAKARFDRPNARSGPTSSSMPSNACKK